MTRVSQIVFRGQAEGYAAAAALVAQPGDVALDHRGVARAFVMRCPDGCGEVLTINLDARAGKAWRADSRGGRLTLYPSVWRSEGCRAHFIIWRDRLIWCDRNDPTPWRDDGLVARVRANLAARAAEFQHYEMVADEIDEIPWEVFWACQLLVHIGEAERRDASHFRLRARKRPKAKLGMWA